MRKTTAGDFYHPQPGADEENQAMTNKPVSFHGGIPSNFYRVPVTVYLPELDVTVRFPHNEGAFHAHKYLLPAMKRATRLRLIDDLARIPDPAEAKRIGRSISLSQEQVDYWDNEAAVVAMLRVNLAKYRQNKACRIWLRNTRDSMLIERARDPIWGDALDGTGRNQLGKVLELVRTMVC